jgi:endonuclease/exonuclease/phosphatase (EEP) superfamily protein YafD
MLALAAAALPGSLIIADLVRAASIEAAAPNEATLKVMTVNVLGVSRNDAAIRALVLAERPDVVLLQEANAVNRRRLVRLLDVLYESALPEANGREQLCPTRLFTHMPLLERQTSPDCGLASGTFSLTEALGGGKIWLGGIHVARRASRTPDMAFVDLTMTERAGSSAILAGDFNATPWSWALRRLEGAGGLTRRTAALPTWPTAAPSVASARRAALPMAAIDHVYASPDWVTREVRRGPNVGSDHFPVIVTLARRRD